MVTLRATDTLDFPTSVWGSWLPLSSSFSQVPLFIFFGRLRGAETKGDTSDIPPSTLDLCSNRNKIFTPGDMVTLRATDTLDFPTSVWGSWLPLSSSFSQVPFFIFSAACAEQRQR